MAILVDGRALPAEPHANLLQVCLSHGLDLPYFCWHPALGAVGACRQCAVKQYHDAEDPHGRLVMACMTAAADGARFSVDDPEAHAFRASVIEWLMSNHPHDCPVCEEGGECHLQDMTLMSGHVYRRYRFRKRTHRNQYLGPFVKHEMNRCIACYRCVRFYRDYAGGRDLDVFGSHNQIYFGRDKDGVLESEFSGNLVEVCPTGVFTDKTLSAVYTRKWDLKSAPSVCVHCGLGCNTFANARYGSMRRIINRYHHELNGYFLCDRGRFGHGFVSAPTRLRAARLSRAGGAPAPIATDAAVRSAAVLLSNGEPVIGIGSPRASLEANFALRSLVGPERFYRGVDAREARLLDRVLQLLRSGSVPIATLREVEQADAALVLGEDLPESAPRLALALRQTTRQASFARAAKQQVAPWQDAAVRDLAADARSPLFIVSADVTRLDEVGTAVRAAPPDITRLGGAILHALDAASPPVATLGEDTRVRAIARALSSAARPVIIAGLSSGDETLLELAAAIAQALQARGQAARLVLTVPECNSLGLALLGGEPLDAALEALHSGQARGAIVLENDLYRRAERARVDAALERAHPLIVLDHTAQPTATRAQLLLPAATFAESSGTLINYEARAQRFFQLLFPEDQVRPSWHWLAEIAGARAAGAPPWSTLDELIAAIGTALPALAPLRAAAPPATLRISGSPIVSAPPRESGRTAMHADRTVHEPPPPPYPDGPYSNSMEGYYGAMPAPLYPFFWAPRWNSEQGLNKFQQEVGGPLRGGPAGAHLFERADSSTPGAARPPTLPPPFVPRSDAWLLVGRPRVFGSDELSAFAPAVAERIAPPALELHPEDAALLALRAGDAVELRLGGNSYRLPVALRAGLVRGVAAVSVGLPQLPYLPLPAWAQLLKAAP